jgi:hypothetical protein
LVVEIISDDEELVRWLLLLTLCCWGGLSGVDEKNETNRFIVGVVLL